jgi:hypothetical protein
MLTMAGAVVVGFVIHKLVANFLGMPDASETFSGAFGNIERSGVPCGADNSVSTFLEGSPACNRMWDCQEAGGTSSWVQHGTGYQVFCNNASPITVNGKGAITSMRTTKKSF